MKQVGALIKMLVVCGVVFLFASVAEAQATRTWVSGVGDDVNPCSRTAPCKTFAGAISKTAKDGEINCLDPGGFGAVTITKSITIDCEDTQGSILASFTNGVVVNITDAADIRKTVRLRGLSINGASTGLDGVRVLATNNAVFLDEVVIDGFTSDCLEVSFATAGFTEIYVRNSSFRNCTNNGVLLNATNLSGVIVMEAHQSLFANNGDGIEAGQRAHVVVKDSSIARNVNAGVRVGGTADAEVDLSNCLVMSNSDGVRVDLGTGRVSFSQVTTNTNGLNNVGGTLKTYQNNAIDSNGANKVGVITNINPG